MDRIGQEIELFFVVITRLLVRMCILMPIHILDKALNEVVDTGSDMLAIILDR